MNAKYECGFEAAKGPVVVNPIVGTQQTRERSDGHSSKASTEPPLRQIGGVRGQPPDDPDWCPGWIRKLTAKNATPEEIVEVALRRLKAVTSEKTLVETQTLINEFSRDPRNTAMLHRQVPRDLLVELHKKGGMR